MLVSEMKHKIKLVYGNKIRGRRVDDMADNQVIAIFYSMEENGRFKKLKKRKVPTYHQIDLYECFGIGQKVV